MNPKKGLINEKEYESFSLLVNTNLITEWVHDIKFSE